VPVNDASHPLVLIILDGFGVVPPADDNAVTLADAPVLQRLLEGADGTLVHLQAHGTAVGLPSDADMGNSEVGHNIMGAGRTFDQGAKQVEEALRTSTIWNGAWQEIVARGRTGGRIHFIGLLSDGNVHSHVRHLAALLDRAAADGARDLVVHALFDGRDVIDGTAERYAADTELLFAGLRQRHGVDARFGSGGGRMSTTMDRYEADWSIVARGWDAHVKGTARPFPTVAKALATLRAEDPRVSDQFLPAFTIVAPDGVPVGSVRPGDAIVLFNFRGDRMIEIYRALTEKPFDRFDRGPVPDDLLVAGMTLYDGDLGIPARYLVQPQRVNDTVSEVVARAGLAQAAIAETQKFGHVTYFWNGNRSDKFNPALEEYVEIPSDQVPFEQRPWMKSAETADEIVRRIGERRFAFIRANFAAGDMVGHTGDVAASTAAVEAMDRAVARVLDAVREVHGTLVLTADHGNCEVLVERGKDGAPLIGSDGRPVPKKSHTLSPVPFVVVDALGRDIQPTPIEQPGLANIGASLLAMLGVAVPEAYAAPVVTID
jgi:2,3-bisphosphoglycerate-independent phosphoglycerate mutase